MKISKGLVTEIITQVIAVGSLIAGRVFAPEDMEIAVAIFAAAEGIGNALVVFFVQQGKIENLEKAVSAVQAAMRRR